MLLKRWIAIENRWNKNCVSRSSLEWTDSQWPSSLKNDKPLVLMGPNVSKAIGMKLCVVASAWYLDSFRLQPYRLWFMSLWNWRNISITIPLHIRLSPSQSSFKQHFKIFLFCSGILVSHFARLQPCRLWFVSFWNWQHKNVVLNKK